MILGRFGVESVEGVGRELLRQIDQGDRARNRGIDKEVPSVNALSTGIVRDRSGIDIYGAHSCVLLDSFVMSRTTLAYFSEPQRASSRPHSHPRKNRRSWCPASTGLGK